MEEKFGTRTAIFLLLFVLFFSTLLLFDLPTTFVFCLLQGCLLSLLGFLFLLFYSGLLSISYNGCLLLGNFLWYISFFHDVFCYACYIGCGIAVLGEGDILCHILGLESLWPPFFRQIIIFHIIQKGYGTFFFLIINCMLTAILIISFLHSFKRRHLYIL